MNFYNNISQHVEILNLNYTKIPNSDISFLSRLNLLTELYLDGFAGNISNPLKLLQNCEKLKILSLNECLNINGKELVDLLFWTENLQVKKSLKKELYINNTGKIADEDIDSISTQSSKKILRCRRSENIIKHK